jgi:hypothetical protein
MTGVASSGHMMQKVIPVSSEVTCKKYRDMLAVSQPPPVRRSMSYLLTDNASRDAADNRVSDQAHDGPDVCEQSISQSSSNSSLISTVRTLSFRLNKRMSGKVSTDPSAIDTGELMMNVIRSPIGLGHFLKFCESEFNSEYLQLFVAVERFRMKEANEAGDYPISIAKDASREGKEYWRSIDDAVAGSTKTGSRTLQLDMKRKEEMMEIWNNFFEDKDDTSTVDLCSSLDIPEPIHRRKSSFLVTAPLSPNFVFLPKSISNNTFRRMEHFDLYGADVFSEAVTEALRVLHRDIFPRFLKSASYEKIIKRRLSADLETVIYPAATSLVVKPPRSEILAELGMRIIHAEGKMYNLKEILRDGILYNEFLVRLKKRGGFHYLLCVQLIALLKDSMRVNPNTNSITTLDSVIEQAWTLYLYFVAEGSCHRIVLNAEQRKHIQLSLGNPVMDMFDELESIAMAELVIFFNRYKGTENYRNLASRALHTAKNILKVEAGTVRSRRSSREQVQSMFTRMNIR